MKLTAIRTFTGREAANVILIAVFVTAIVKAARHEPTCSSTASEERFTAKAKCFVPDLPGLLFNISEQKAGRSEEQAGPSQFMDEFLVHFVGSAGHVPFGSAHSLLNGCSAVKGPHASLLL